MSENKHEQTQKRDGPDGANQPKQSSIPKAG